jgi:hypothetical protein
MGTWIPPPGDRIVYRLETSSSVSWPEAKVMSVAKRLGRNSAMAKDWPWGCIMTRDGHETDECPISL